MTRVISGFLLVAGIAQAQTAQGVDEFRRGLYTQARTHLEAASKASPDDETARGFLALTQAATGHCGEAMPVLSQAFHTPELARLAGLSLVQCHLAADRTAEALPLLVRLETQFPGDADVLYLAAKVHMRAWNDTMQTLFEKAPASYRVNQLSAEVFETQGRYAEAVAEYRKAIAKNPQALNLRYRLGRALLLQSHDAASLTQAQAAFTAELQLNPEDAAAEYQLGQIAQVQGKRDEAAPHFAKAAALRPDFPEALIASAKLMLDAKQPLDAIPLLRKAVELQPASEAAHYNLMLAYRNSGQMEQAREEKKRLDTLQRPPEGEFTDFLKKLGEKPQP